MVKDDKNWTRFSRRTLKILRTNKVLKKGKKRGEDHLFVGFWVFPQGKSRHLLAGGGESQGFQEDSRKGRGSGVGPDTPQSRGGHPAKAVTPLV